MNDDVFSPLVKRPALIAFLATASMISMAEHPIYAVALMPITLWVGMQVPRWLLKMCLCVLAIAGLSLFLSKSEEARFALRIAGDPPKQSLGEVLSVLPRKDGFAFIVETPEGKFRLALKQSSESPSPILPGDSLSFFASWYPREAPTVPGAFDSPKWLAAQKLVAHGRLDSFEITGRTFRFERHFFQFRQWVKKRLSRFCSPGEAGLLLGLIVGDRSGIPEALHNDFLRSGLVHVLAISGFHVALLSGMLMLFLKALRLPHNFARALGIILLVCYVPITGASAAVTRAVAMFSIAELAKMCQRKADSLNTLGVALLCIVLVSPSELWSAGFQLSASATAGIIVGVQKNPLKKISKKLDKKFWSAFLNSFVIQSTFVTFCATLATAPFLVYHFKSFSPIAWLGNIVIVPLVSLAMHAGLFSLLSPFDFLQENFSSSAEFLLRLAAKLTKLLSSSPRAQLTIGPFPVPILLVAGSLFAIFPLAFKIRFYKKLAFFLSSILAICFLSQSILEKVRPHWHAAILDVDQADCILVSTPKGKHFLFDTGNSGKKERITGRVIPYLRNRGIRALDAVVITHADADHYGGLTTLLNNFPTREIWISECAHTENKPEWQEVLSKSYAKAPVRDISAGFFYREKNFSLQALHPQKNASHCGETNRESITFLASGFGRGVLLTGDLSKEGEEEILQTTFPIRADILKLGHHGSKTSSSRNFLTEVSPIYSVASSGKNNRYKHPSKEIVSRLDSMKIPLINTAKDGSAFIDIDEQGLSLKTSKGLFRYYPSKDGF